MLRHFPSLFYKGSGARKRSCKLKRSLSAPTETHSVTL